MPTSQNQPETEEVKSASERPVLEGNPGDLLYYGKKIVDGKVVDDIRRRDGKPISEATLRRYRKQIERAKANFYAQYSELVGKEITEASAQQHMEEQLAAGAQPDTIAMYAPLTREELKAKREADTKLKAKRETEATAKATANPGQEEASLWSWRGLKNSWLGRRFGLDDHADQREGFLSDPLGYAGNALSTLGGWFGIGGDDKATKQGEQEEASLWSWKGLKNSWLGRRFGLDDHADQREGFLSDPLGYVGNAFSTLGSWFGIGGDDKATTQTQQAQEEPSLWSWKGLKNSWLGRRLGLDDHADQRESFISNPTEYISGAYTATKELFTSDEKAPKTGQGANKALGQAGSNVTQTATPPQQPQQNQSAAKNSGGR